MRILYVINSLDGGGGALPLPHILGVMRSAGHTVEVVSLMERDGRARPLLDAAGIPYRVIGGPRRRFLPTALRLDRIVRDWRPDLIWTSLTHATITGQIIGRLRGIPVMSWQHNAWLKPANLRILRHTAPLSRHWVTDSETVRRFAVEQLGIAPEGITVWPLYMADPGAPRARPGNTGPLRLGSLGRLHRNKGYDVLIRALAILDRRLPGAATRLSVHIAGEGPERAALEQLASELGVVNFHLGGFTDRPVDFLADLDAYIQPSHHEGLCIAAHQAMTAGLPVIASPAGEMARSVELSGCGILVPYGDAEAMATAIETLLLRPDLAGAMGDAGRAWVLREYSRETFEARGLEALAHVLPGSRAATRDCVAPAS